MRSLGTVLGGHVCLIFAPRIPHQCPAGADGHAVVAPEATELLWLVGRVSSSGVFVWSVMNCSRLGASKILPGPLYCRKEHAL